MATKWVYKFSEGNAEMRNLLGGKGANQAVAAARLGGSVTFVTSLGNDMYADILKKNFEKEGITAIEWPEKIENLLPSSTISLYFTHQEPCRIVRYEPI